MLACIKYLPLLLLQRPATAAKHEVDTVDRRVYYMISGCVKMQQNLNVQEDEKSRCKEIRTLLNHM